VTALSAAPEPSNLSGSAKSRPWPWHPVHQRRVGSSPVPASPRDCRNDDTTALDTRSRTVAAACEVDAGSQLAHRCAVGYEGVKQLRST
jgi:hypothetical protein